MHTFKNFVMSIVHSFCRLITCALWQLPWLVIVVGGALWFKHRIPMTIHTHFGLDSAKDNVELLTSLAKTMKTTASLTNPSAFFSYLMTLLERTNANAKYTMIQITSNTIESIIIWALDLIITIALIYAVFRIYKAWRADTKTHEMTKMIVNQITPQIEALHTQISILQQELSDLKDELKQKK